MDSKSPNASISLSSPVYEVKNVSKATRAKFWRELKTGDRIQFHNTIQYVGGASNGLYATYYRVSILGSKPEISGMFSQNEICRYLKIINISEVCLEQALNSKKMVLVIIPYALAETDTRWMGTQ